MEIHPIDVSNIGRETFNINIMQLKNDKKLLKLYSQNIQLLINSINDNRNSLKKAMKEMDKYSPMDHPFCFLKKFQIIINAYHSYFKIFWGKSQKILEHLNNEVDSNLSMISTFLSNNQLIIENIKLKSEFISKQNEIVLNSFQETEKAIMDDYFKLTYNLKFNNNEDKSIRPTKEELINDSHKVENDFLAFSLEIKDLIKKYIQEYNSNIKKLKSKMIDLSNITKNDILSIKELFKDVYNELLNSTENDFQSLESFDINSIENEQSLNKYLIYEIKENDLSECFKPQLYQFQIKEKFNIRLNKLYDFKETNSTMNLSVTKKDIYNIMEQIYSYHFNMIDKSYNLGLEKNKLEIIEKTGKLLGYDFLKNNKIEVEIFPENEVNNFINYLFTNEEYLMQFFIVLNNFRADGDLEFTEAQFDIFKNIFCKASDYLLEHCINQLYYLIIILSQTFYKLNNGKKHFLQEEIKEKEFFINTQFWIDFISDMINDELNKMEEYSKEICEDEEKKKVRKDEIIFSKFLSLVPSFNGFSLSKESLLSITNTLFEKYNIKEERKESFFSLITKLKN